MSTYFDNFPIISYNGINVRDISRRKKFMQKNMNNPFIFLPYTIKDGEKPEDISYYYYGSVEYTWLVLLANNIIDPYTGWIMTQENLDKMIIEKYREQSGLTGTDVLYWTQNDTSFSNILFYYKENDSGDMLKLSPNSFETYLLKTENDLVIQSENGSRFIIDKIIPIEWKPMRIYDYEYLANESKRSIILVDKAFLPQIEKEFKRFMKN